MFTFLLLDGDFDAVLPSSMAFRLMNHSTTDIADAQAREEALHPQRSYIVQAPAGSGKTGLLTQRFLRLLTLADHPETVVALTFTRKAAAEMKHRILDALQTAHQPTSGHHDTRFAERTKQLAQEVLAQDRKQSWQLMAHPGRLRILTIDAFCANLTRQLPLLSGFGGRFGIADDPPTLYRRAARATLEEGQHTTRWSPAVATLLDHRDNFFPAVESLLASMLSRRDQWLRHIGGPHTDIRPLLENVLRQVVTDALVALKTLLTAEEQTALWALAGFAGEHLRRTPSSSPLTACHATDPFPTATPDAHGPWLGIAELLLTLEGTWRKKITVTQGFPPVAQGKSAKEKARFKTMKAQLTTQIEALSVRPMLLERLNQVRILPPPSYTDAQWHILDALLTLLPMAVAQLRLIFQERGEVDFSEVAMRAEMALGSPEAPTDLALKLDYQIRHILVDEFQDTSHGQYRLLQALTAEWHAGDGRTLFLVGDPMQSIYRFREADVGLFLKARHQGLATVPLIPLTLTVNFRSQANLVAWINTAFTSIFPRKEEITVGAVPFNPSAPFQPPCDGPAVEVHPFHTHDPHAEAAHIVTLITQAQADPHRNPAEKTAILVRSRSHLDAILPALDQAGLRYQGVDIASLATSMVIQDLLSLTRALSCPADRVAWLATLRAPWCGLSLTDLHALAQPTPENPATLWEQIHTEAVYNRLTTDGQRRLSQLRSVLADPMDHYRRCHAFPGISTLRFWVERCWQALGGPATVQKPHALADAQRYFELLAATERGGELENFSHFADNVARLYTGSETTDDASVVIMTIHKAKGLEFDTVILPGLGRRPRGETKSLLAWMEHPAGLLLGPIERTDQTQDDPIQALIRGMEKQKTTFEAGRLLYVAATRARRRLHLLGHLKDAEETTQPASHAFLSLLWGSDGQESMVRRCFQQAAPSPLSSTPSTTAETTPHAPHTRPTPPLRRLAADWSPPPPPAPFAEERDDVPIGDEPLPFTWAGETIRSIGVVVHRFLCTMANEGVATWSLARLQDRQTAFAAHLDRLGVPEEQMPGAIQRVIHALQHTLSDERGRWILDNSRHDTPASELALTGIIQGTLHRVVLDRTFIDQAGVRWVIDFKTSLHEGGDLETFVDNEQTRYQGQMARYGALIEALDREKSTRPIHFGLYFPMHQRWRAWRMAHEA